MDENQIPYIWSKDLILQDYKGSLTDFGKNSDQYFIPNNGHPTTYNNTLIARELKKYILENSQ